MAASESEQNVNRWGEVPYTPLVWLPVLVLLPAEIVIWALDMSGVYPAPFLLMSLNFVFLGLFSPLIAYLVARSFVVRRTPGLLVLGCGAMIWCAAGLVASVVGHRTGAVTIITHNISAALSAMLHLIGAFLLFRQPRREMNTASPWLATGYTLSFSIPVVIVVFVAAGWRPVFFVQGQGGTPIRQVLLSSAITMFVLSAALLRKANRHSDYPFLKWYVPALALLATGLFGVTLQTAFNSALSWTGRTGQYLAWVYVLIAAIRAARDSHVWGSTLEKTLRATEERLKFHMENTPLAVIEWGADFRLTRWSGEAERIFGWRADEVLGKRLDEFRWVFEEDKAEVADVSAGLLNGKQSRSVSVNRNYRKDGSVAYCEWYNSSLLDSKGRLVSILSLVLDVTDRKHMEDALREREEQARARAAELSAILDSMPALTFIAQDPECHTMTSSRAAHELLRVPYGANTSRSAPENEAPQFRTMRNDQEIPADDLPVQVAARTGREVRDSEFTVAFDDGTSLDLFGHAVPLFDENGKVRGAVGAFIDISQRKQIERALIRSEKLASVGRMAATIAHEINNPLEAVVNALYIARKHEGDLASVRSLLELADAELVRVSHITRQALGFYREASAPTTFPVKTLFDSAVDLLKRRIGSKSVHVDVRCDENLQVTAVPGEVRQVVTNLLANSLDAVEDGGRIQLRASIVPLRSTEQIRITVADNGRGIARQALQHVFEPFFTTKEAVGTGLGLWVSKQIIEKHGGSIRVRSCARGPRRGTIVSILLPAAAAAGENMRSVQGRAS